MFKYTIKRVLQSLGTVLIVVSIVSLLLSLMPTDYFFTEEQLIKLTDKQKEDQLAAAGLLDSPIVQLFRFLENLILKFDLGTSRRIQAGVPVIKVIGDKFAISMRLGCIALVISLILGVPMGILQARHKDHLFDHIGAAYTIFVNAVPRLVSYSLVLVIGAAFYLVAFSTVRLVGDALFSDAIRSHAAQTQNLAAALGEKLGSDTADAFHQRLLQAASQSGGRLLVVDADGKVTYDTFGERCGTLLALGEVRSVLRGEKDADYGFHLRDGAGKTQAPSVLDALTGRDISRVWVGCFVSPLEADGQRTGALLLLTDVQETVDSLISVRDRMAFIFLLALTAVLVLAGLISRIVTRPVAELSGGIERMSKGDYEYRVHVQGKGEMAQLAAAFNQMSEQVHNLDEARNQFVSNASHELKTPLATIKILVESMMYQDDMDPQLRREFLGDIDKEIDRLSSVVGDLLTLVHIDSHKLRLRREMMVLADTVRETAARLGPLAKKRGQQIVVHIQDECEMFADPGKLAQVCYNIIENAIKYTPDGGTITVSLAKAGRDAVLEIADTGVGIPETDLPHVFDRFYRVDKARSRETGGTGLGLSIVKQIVRLHAGTVTVASEYGKGTTFTVQLPVK